MLETPILLIAFNRPEITNKVFEKIRNSKPKRLYIAIDGPRSNIPFEQEKVNKVSDIFKNIDWDCKTYFLKRKSNLGCKKSVSEAIEWFFKHEKLGIILEDDCLPNSDFFLYCQELLLRYEHNKKIYMITGDNFQDGIIRGTDSYYFSKLTHVWGWATWRRAWDNYDSSMSFWPSFKKSEEFKKIFNSNSEQRYFKSIFDAVHKDKIDTWDYQWTASMWHKGGLSITPNKNLVENIGFGPDATHTKIETPRTRSQLTQEILPLTHPSLVIRDYKADEYVFLNVFGGSKMGLLRRIIQKLKSLMLN
tara:strand:- start:181 stop:1095 length:915 start_codon:yes stop_codon:yes gene_type:complete